MTITVLGASGFIGSQLTEYLRKKDIAHYVPQKDDQAIFKRHLGQVIYCIGLTADFRTRPFDTIEAHVCYLKKVLTECQFDSLVYLSSTRIYSRTKCIAAVKETDELAVEPASPGDLYNISKIAGESICLACKNRAVKVARLSNVYGMDFESRNFVTEIITESITKGMVTLRSSMDSAKDYISIEDVVELLVKVLIAGEKKIYNIASGMNVSNADIVQKIQEMTGCGLSVDYNSPSFEFPLIDIDNIQKEFGFSPRCILDDLEKLVPLYKKHIEREL